MIKENIRNLETRVFIVFTEHRYSENSIKRILVITRALIRRHLSHGEEYFKTDIADNYVKLQEKRYQNQAIGKGAFNAYKNIIGYLKQINETGTINKKKIEQVSNLSNYFERILSNLLTNEEWSPKNRKHNRNHAHTFFLWLFSRGHNDLSRVDEQVVRDYLTDCSTRMVGYSLDNTRRALKNLFLFLSENGVLSEQLNKLFLFKVPIEKKIKHFMPQDEIAAVLDVINRNTARGKRDYALILLAAVTGLRSIDVIELKLNEIHWHSGEIKIIQKKTGNSHVLPLTADVGKAIEDYILNARPKSGLDKVFLSTRVPFGVLHRQTPIKILQAYCTKAGLPTRWGFHTLRRWIATSMITSGVSVITAAQVLGHKTIDSTKQYISLDSRNLKECALDFSGIEVKNNVRSILRGGVAL